jgi:hypothetical protein
VRRTLLFIWLSLFLTPMAAQAKDEVVAVISYELAPFKEARQGFNAQFGHPVNVIHLAKEPFQLRGEPRVAVAFGGKAALQKYPDGSALIYCMAPGTSISPSSHIGPLTEVSMMPKAPGMLARLKEIQPTLHRLAIFWISPSNETYINELRKYARPLGIEIQSEHLADAGQIPDYLRRLKDHTDALWIPPDPLIVTEQNLVLLAQFSSSSHIPYYSSVNGLAEKGAVASIASSYAEIGRMAAQTAQMALSGSTIPSEVYPEKAEVTLNMSAAEKAGLTIDKNQLTHVEKVLP